MTAAILSVAVAYRQLRYQREGRASHAPKAFQHGQPLSPEARAEIRRRVANHEPMPQVAADLGVHYQTVVAHTRDIRGVE